MVYDAKIIQEFAERLYRRAHSIIITYTVAGFIVGLVSGTFVGRTAGSADLAGTIIITTIILGGLFGYVIAKERAFKFKLDAQIALCQVQIEKNTSKK